MSMSRIEYLRHSAKNGDYVICACESECYVCGGEPACTVPGELLPPDHCPHRSEGEHVVVCEDCAECSGMDPRDWPACE